MIFVSVYLTSAHIEPGSAEDTRADSDHAIPEFIATDLFTHSEFGKASARHGHQHQRRAAAGRRPSIARPLPSQRRARLVHPAARIVCAAKFSHGISRPSPRADWRTRHDPPSRHAPRYAPATLACAPGSARGGVASACSRRASLCVLAALASASAPTSHSSRSAPAAGR